MREEGRARLVDPLVRYRGNDYSVPTTYGFRDVLVKGFVEEVVILCAGVEIAGTRAATAAAFSSPNLCTTSR